MSKSQAPSLEITVISAEGLSIGNRSISKNIIVTIRTDPINQQSTRVEGGIYPKWNDKLQLPLPHGKWVVGVEVQRKKSSGSNETIGTANIPMADVVGAYIPPDHLHFLSYRLRGKDGGRNGIVNLSIKVVGQQTEMGKPSLFNSGFAVGIPVTPKTHTSSVQGVPINRMTVPRFEYVKS